jgi:acyl-CoA thioester hydrolase
MWYTGKFDEATWHMFKLVGVIPSYLRHNRRGMVAVQQETTYKRELVGGDLITICSSILEIREKVIRFYHEMLNAQTMSFDFLLVGASRDEHSCWSGADQGQG